MVLITLVVIQLAATIGAFALVWRKLDVMSGDIASIRRMMETLEMMRVVNPAARRAEPARASAYATPEARTEDSEARPNDLRPLRPALARPTSNSEAARTRFPLRPLMANDVPEELAPSWRANVSAETGRVIAAALMSVAPAIGFAFDLAAPGIIAAGLAIAAALMLVSFRQLWRAAAWIGVLGAAAWVNTGFVLGAATTAPLSFSLLTVLAGAAGIAHARLRGPTPGSAIALVSAAALLALGADIGIASAAGIAFGALAVITALVGASSLRVEGLLMAAFIGAGAGLFILSGQTDAAVWFTPATAWTGALFFAIAAVRAPMLGPRAILVVGAGCAAPIVATATLVASQQGLDRIAASGVFASLTMMFFGLLGLCASRQNRGIAALGLTAWVILTAAIVACAFAVGLAAPPAYIATALGVLALGLITVDQRYPDGLWRGGAIASLIGAAIAALVSLQTGWPHLVTIAAAFVAPALCASGAAYLAQSKTPRTAAFLESAALINGVAALTLLTRFAFAAGEPNANPIGFIEVGTFVALLLGASLALAYRQHRGARGVRKAALHALAITALCAMTVAGLLWLTPFWSGRPVSVFANAVMQHAPLGFALPAIVAWALWAYWRARGAHLRTRVSLGAAALLTAAFISLEVSGARAGATLPGAIDWVQVSVALAAFAAGIGLNFAPGVVAEPGSQFSEYFHRKGRGEQRG